MKKLMGFTGAVVMALMFAGCASTGAASQPAMAGVRANNYLAAGPVPQDPNPHGVVMSASESPRTLGDIDPRAGIPTPEPAAPQREIQFAGPTPQVPIPGSGHAGIPRD